MGKKKLHNTNKNEGKSIWLIGDILFLLYRFESGLLRYIIRSIILKLEGNTLYSLTIRRIFSEYHNVDIGMYSSYGCFIPYNFGPGTKIGRYCTIAKNIHAFQANHPMNLKSMHAFFYYPRFGFTNTNLINYTQLTIGNDVYIGHNAIILPSVKSIGDGAVIGAGSIVNIDIPPYAVVVGHPCRIVRYRFSRSTLQELLDSKWWEKSIEELKPELDSFQHPLEGEEEIR